MLGLSRKIDERLVIRLGDHTVVIRVLALMRDRVRISVIAPREVAVHREEAARRIPEWKEDFDALLADAVPQF